MPAVREWPDVVRTRPKGFVGQFHLRIELRTVDVRGLHIRQQIACLGNHGRRKIDWRRLGFDEPARRTVYRLGIGKRTPNVGVEGVNCAGGWWNGPFIVACR